MFNILVIIAGLAVGSITDIKTREVPDTLNFSLISIGLLSGAFLSLFHSTPSYFISSLLGLLAGFLIGLMLFYAGQWGGGDAKMVMGVGALIGLSFHELTTGMPLFFLFIINSLLIGAVYGLVWVAVLGLKNIKKVKKEFGAVRTAKQAILLRKLLLVFLVIVIPLLFIASIPFFAKAILLTALFFFFISFHASMLLRSIERTVMVKKISVSKLTEGDWVIGMIKLKDNSSFNPSRTGVSLGDIKMLKKNGVREVHVKEGIPFVPSFFLAYIATLILGNWLYTVF